MPVIIGSGVDPSLNDLDGCSDSVFGLNLGADLGGLLPHLCIAHGAGDRLRQAVPG